MKRLSSELKRAQPQIHSTANRLDLAGIVYNTDSKLITQSEDWSFGRTDKIIVEGDHDVSITRGHHTILLFEDGENIRGSGMIDGKPVYRRGLLRGKIDLIPKDAEFKASYIGPTLRLTTISFSDELISLVPSRADFFSISARFYLKDSFLTAAFSEFIKNDSALVKETLALAILSHSSTLQPSSSSRGGGRLSNGLKNLLTEYIEENLDTEIKITDLAKLAQISTFYFIKLFRNTFELTPYQYIIQRRITRAEILLTHTRNPIINIALECGFQGASQFSYAFKKYKGLSPIEFRKKQSMI